MATGLDWAQLPVAGLAARTPLDTARAMVAQTQEEIRNAVDECLQAQGYPSESPRDEASERQVLLSIIGRPPSEEAALERGFFVASVMRTPQTDSFAQSESWNAYVNGLSGAERQVLSGAGNECAISTGAAMKTDNGSVLATLVDTYVVEVLGVTVMNDAQAHWAECISGRGYEASSYNDVRNSLYPLIEPALASSFTSDQGPLEVLWDAEQAAALDVARCDVEAFDPVLAEWSEREEAWLEEHAGDYDSLSPQIRLSFANMVGL